MAQTMISKDVRVVKPGHKRDGQEGVVMAVAPRVPYARVCFENPLDYNKVWSFHFDDLEVLEDDF